MIQKLKLKYNLQKVKGYVHHTKKGSKIHIHHKDYSDISDFKAIIQNNVNENYKAVSVSTYSEKEGADRFVTFELK